MKKITVRQKNSIRNKLMERVYKIDPAQKTTKAFRYCNQVFDLIYLILTAPEDPIWFTINEDELRDKIYDYNNLFTNVESQGIWLDECPISTSCVEDEDFSDQSNCLDDLLQCGIFNERRDVVVCLVQELRPFFKPKPKPKPKFKPLTLEEAKSFIPMLSGGMISVEEFVTGDERSCWACRNDVKTYSAIEFYETWVDICHDCIEKRRGYGGKK